MFTTSETDSNKTKATLIDKNTIEIEGDLATIKILSSHINSFYFHDSRSNNKTKFNISAKLVIPESKNSSYKLLAFGKLETLQNILDQYSIKIMNIDVKNNNINQQSNSIAENKCELTTEKKDVLIFSKQSKTLENILTKENILIEKQLEKNIIQNISTQDDTPVEKQPEKIVRPSSK